MNRKKISSSSSFSKTKVQCDCDSSLKGSNYKKMKGVKHLPEGSGSYLVGCLDIMTERNGQDKNGSFFRLYYPTGLATNNSTNNKDIELPSTPSSGASSPSSEPDDPQEQLYKMNSKNNEETSCPRWPKWLPKPRYRDGYMHFLGKENSTFYNCLFDWFGGEVYVPALWDAPLLPQEICNQFPVIVFSHGLGGIRTTYSTVCLDLSSQGFIVAALEHRDGSASATYYLNRYSSVDPLKSSSRSSTEDSSPDDNQPSSPTSQVYEEEWKIFERYDTWDDFMVRNAQLQQRTEECIKVLDILCKINDGLELDNLEPSQVDLNDFKNRMNMLWVCVAGHSFGGATAVATLAKDKRFKVGVVLDGWMLPLDDNVYPCVTQPVLMVNTETFQWKKNILSMKKLESKDVERVIITIRGTCHQSSTDFQFLFNKFVGRIMKARYTLSPKLAVELTGKAMQGFIWKHLGFTDKDYQKFIISGEHELVISGTNVDLSN